MAIHFSSDASGRAARDGSESSTFEARLFILSWNCDRNCLSFSPPLRHLRGRSLRLLCWALLGFFAAGQRQDQQSRGDNKWNEPPRRSGDRSHRPRLARRQRSVKSRRGRQQGRRFQRVKRTVAALALCLAGASAVVDERALSAVFGWIGPDGQRERAPVVEFDFEGIFQRDEAGGSRLIEEAPLLPLADVLSPRELESALGVARAILRRASPRSRAARAVWRDPVARKRMISGIRRALGTPASKLRRSNLPPQVRQRKRELARRMWQERREEFLARMHLPEYRERMARMARARWADPAFRARMLVSFRSPEARQRASAGVRRHLQRHPEARRRRAEAMRRLWSDPTHRKWRGDRIRAGWAARRVRAEPAQPKAASSERDLIAGDP